MIKRILYYILSFGLLLLSGFYVHKGILSSTEKALDFSLFNIYAFHAVFSFVICTLLLVISKFPKFAAQLGFLYLGGFLLKFFVFAAVFQGLVLRESPLTSIESVSLLLPIVIFLTLEVYFVAKLLRMIDAKQK